MERTRAMVYMFLYIALFGQGTICFSSTQENQCDKEGYTAKRTQKQEENHNHEVHCSRARSRAAWKFIEEYLMPFVEREKYEISRSCRLHPDNDIFRDQEHHKISVDIDEWLCGYCMKTFEAEKFLDQHFDSRHYDLLNVSHSKCLADLCGALHCDLVVDSNSKSRKTKCNAAAAARNHHLCESLAVRCFPTNHIPQQTVFMNCFCGNFAMLTLAQEDENPFQEAGGSIQASSTWRFQY